ncbi:LuxR C-terminal-related transcriptional regulator [Raoultella ornithinolytica]
MPEVLRLKAQWYTNRDIADDIQISPSTVSVYLKRDRPLSKQALSDNSPL